MHLFHTWGKWEEYVEPMMIMLNKNLYGEKTVQSNAIWQKRTCLVCGKSQREQIVSAQREF